MTLEGILKYRDAAIAAMDEVVDENSSRNMLSINELRSAVDGPLRKRSVEWKVESLSELLDSHGIWYPTEQDYRECCGDWVHRYDHYGKATKVTPFDLEFFWKSRQEFDAAYNSDWTKIEPIPEQCIPMKEEPMERYAAIDLETTAFPTLVEFLGEY